MNTVKHSRYSVGGWVSDDTGSWWAKIYVAGDYHTSEMVCRQQCFPKGLCVTIEKTKYVFAGGSEDGVCVGLIQYVPFAELENVLIKKAERLGRAIAEANYQWSFSIITPQKSIFHSRRKE